MNWTQPICLECFRTENDREPYAMKPEMRVTERCCMCGEQTDEGIYARINPALVAYPSKDDDE